MTSSTPDDIVLPDDQGVTMQLVMAPEDDGDYKIDLFTGPRTGAPLCWLPLGWCQTAQKATGQKS